MMQAVLQEQRSVGVLRSNNFAFLPRSLTAAALGLICIKAPNLKENRQAEA